MKEDRICIPIGVEYLFSNIFGKKNYHGFAGHLTLASWKKHLSKLIGAVRKSILVNIDTSDEYHRKCLLVHCDTAKREIKNAKSNNQANLSAIECMVKLVFGLMGHTPDNWNRKVLNRSDHYRLDRYRKITYTQTVN